jgi:thiol:disulfide interchange protein DsbD
MAMTLTITSFTCTFPVVGGLLVLAAGGNYFYPVIGLATFAAVVALPFFLLALSPGMLSKVPKSGDWMNAVKVVGGLVEIGAAFKFINTAETAFVVASEAWFNAQTVLTIWVILALVCGIYLLGLFRTDHDHEAVRVGPIRILLGSLFLFLSLFLAPALFGRPPQSKIWSLVVGLLPGDAGNLTAKSVGLAAVGGEESKASSTDPKLAEREQKSFHGVAWGMSYEAAVEEGRKQNKPILIDFTGVNCANCRLMEQDVLPKADVVAVLKEFITVQLYTDIVQISSITQEQREALASANLDKALKLANSAANPNYVIISPDAEVLGVKGGAMSTTEFIAHLKAGLEKFKKGSKLAQN